MYLKNTRYITFRDLLDLEAALKRDGEELAGRGIKVDVSEERA
jgi:hypothetical protein